MKLKDLKSQWNVTIKDSEIQRNLIWSKEFKEKLFESVLNNKPIGCITLFTENGKKYKQIIDGKQRIYALESFWKGEISYKGKFFNEEEWPDFWNYEIIIQESSGTFKDMVELFNKINTCVIPLSEFELLRAKYNGDFVEGLSDWVNSNKYVREVLKNNSRGKNEMLILNLLIGTYTLDDWLKLHKDDDFNMFSKLPNQIFMFIKEVFKKYDEIQVMMSIAKTYEKNKTELIQNRDNIDNDIKILKKTQHLEGWDKFSEYERIIDRYAIDKDKKRIFSQLIKEELWKEAKKSNTNQKVFCALCGQEIDKYDDAEVDHIVPWTKGGKTEKSNAQLAHKHCNVIKGSKE